MREIFSQLFIVLVCITNAFFVSLISTSEVVAYKCLMAYCPCTCNLRPVSRGYSETKREFPPIFKFEAREITSFSQHFFS